MKGDYVKVTYRTGAGTDSSEIVARVDGYKLDWELPREKDRFVVVEVQNRNGVMVEKHLFAAGEVVAITSGHKTAAQMFAKPRAKRTRVTRIGANDEPILDDTPADPE